MEHEAGAAMTGKALWWPIRNLLWDEVASETLDVMESDLWLRARMAANDQSIIQVSRIQNSLSWLLEEGW